MVSYGTRQQTIEDVYPAATFKKGITESINELTSFLSFIEHLENDSTNIFLELSKHVTGSNSIVFSAIGKIKIERKSMKHELQKYLSYIADRQFQDYLKRKGMVNSGLYITVSDKNSYPSKFVVMNETQNICAFDIYQHFYGRRKTYPVSSLDRDIEHYKNEITYHEEELLYYSNIKEKPFKQTKFFRDWYYLITKRKAVFDGLEKKIRNHKAMINDLQVNMQKRIDNEPHIKANHQKEEEHFIIVDTFFKEMNYERTLDKDVKLY